MIRRDHKVFLSCLRSIVLATLVTFASCTQIRDRTDYEGNTDMKEYFKAMLEDVNSVEIQYFQEDDTLSQKLTKADEIDAYKELIDGSIDVYRELASGGKEVKCDTTGKLLYFVNGSLKFQAYFSTPRTGSKYNTAVAEYYCKPDVYRTLFSSREEMRIDEYFQELKSRKSSLQNGR